MTAALKLAAMLVRNRPWDDNPSLDDVMQEAAVLLRTYHDAAIVPPVAKRLGFTLAACDCEPEIEHCRVCDARRMLVAMEME